MPSRGPARRHRLLKWDARYSESDGAMWGGRPNWRLVTKVADLTSGGALEVSRAKRCDAIRLTQRGFRRLVDAGPGATRAAGGRRRETSGVRGQGEVAPAWRGSQSLELGELHELSTGRRQLV